MPLNYLPERRGWEDEWHTPFSLLANDVKDFINLLIPVLSEAGIDSRQITLTAMNSYLKDYPSSLPDSIWWEVQGCEIVSISEELKEKGELSYSLTLEKDAGIIADIIKKIQFARQPVEEDSDISNLEAIMLSITKEHLGAN